MSTWKEYVQDLGSYNSNALVEHIMAFEWFESQDAMVEFRRDIISDPTVHVASWQQTHAVDWAKWSDLLIARGEVQVLKALAAHRLHRHTVHALSDSDVSIIAKPCRHLEASYQRTQRDGQLLEAAQEARALLHHRVRHSDHRRPNPDPNPNATAQSHHRATNSHHLPIRLPSLSQLVSTGAAGRSLAFFVERTHRCTY